MAQPSGSIKPAHFGYRVPDVVTTERLYMLFTVAPPMSHYNGDYLGDKGQQVSARIQARLGNYNVLPWRARLSNMGLDVSILPVAGWSAVVVSTNQWVSYDAYHPWVVAEMVMPSAGRGYVADIIDAVNVISRNKITIIGDPAAELCHRGGHQSYQETDGPPAEYRSLSSWDVMGAAWAYNRYQREELVYFTVPLFRGEVL